VRSRNSATAAVARVGVFCVATALTLSCGAPSSKADDPQAAEDAIRQQIANYATALDAADIHLASQVWHTSGDISFITPAGHYRGWDEVKKVYEFFGSAFSERNLTVRDVSVRVYGDSAWSEFYWHFDAKQSGDGTAVQTDGRATQIHRRVDGNGWVLVHEHYSGMPMTP